VIAIADDYASPGEVIASSGTTHFGACLNEKCGESFARKVRGGNETVVASTNDNGIKVARWWFRHLFILSLR
jgi:hypothetical protein